MKQRIISLFLTVLMMLSMVTVASAAGDPQLDIVAKNQSGQTVVEVYVNGVDITNGRLEVEYDAARVTLLDAVPGSDKWVTSVDEETLGLVSFAWVNSDISTRTKVLTLVFTMPTEDTILTVFTVELTEVYASGEKLDLPPLTHTAIMGPGYSDITPSPSDPEVPLPTPPSPPVEGDEPALDHPFTDIEDHWAEDEIIAAYKAGLVNGTTATTFAPNATLNRGMFVTLLYRLAGEPAVSGSHPFTDVPSDQYYSKAVLWAYQNGVVNGLSDTTFVPSGIVSRQQMVTMLCRYAKLTGVDVSASADLSRFSDGHTVASWAVESVQWAVAEEILKGSDGALDPNGNTTRAQAAAILVRFAS